MRKSEATKTDKFNLQAFCPGYSLTSLLLSVFLSITAVVFLISHLQFRTSFLSILNDRLLNDYGFSRIQSNESFFGRVLLVDIGVWPHPGDKSPWACETRDKTVNLIRDMLEQIDFRPQNGKSMETCVFVDMTFSTPASDFAMRALARTIKSIDPGNIVLPVEVVKGEIEFPKNSFWGELSGSDSFNDLIASASLVSFHGEGLRHHRYFFELNNGKKILSVGARLSSSLGYGFKIQPFDGLSRLKFRFYRGNPSGNLGGATLCSLGGQLPELKGWNAIVIGQFMETSLGSDNHPVMASTAEGILDDQPGMLIHLNSATAIALGDYVKSPEPWQVRSAIAAALIFLSVAWFLIFLFWGRFAPAKYNLRHWAYLIVLALEGFIVLYTSNLIINRLSIEVPCAAVLLSLLIFGPALMLFNLIFHYLEVCCLKWWKYSGLPVFLKCRVINALSEASPMLGLNLVFDAFQDIMAYLAVCETQGYLKRSALIEPDPSGPSPGQMKAFELIRGCLLRPTEGKLIKLVKKLSRIDCSENKKYTSNFETIASKLCTLRNKYRHFSSTGKQISNWREDYGKARGYLAALLEETRFAWNTRNFGIAPQMSVTDSCPWSAYIHYEDAGVDLFPLAGRFYCSHHGRMEFFIYTSGLFEKHDFPEMNGETPNCLADFGPVKDESYTDKLKSFEKRFSHDQLSR